MIRNRTNALAWWSAATILVSAFLLFQVQPVISKKILPWFGGSPAVWTTCVLFFQLVLLGGYAYAHWLIRYVPPRLQGPIHISLLVVALCTFPITAAGGYWNIQPSDLWKPADGAFPAARILLLLAAKVGAPFFIASTTGPLVQAWFSQLYPGRSPYRLYALSNVGSLAALLTYPFFIETMFRVDRQGSLWSLGFLVFAGLIGMLAVTMARFARETLAGEPAASNGATAIDPAKKTDITAAEGLIAKRKPGEAESEASLPVETAPRLSLRVAWLTLAGLASLAFLAITNHLCQDIAVVPFMWVIPLSLYLLSFIICFDNERWYLRKTFGIVTILAILWLTAMHNYQAVDKALVSLRVPAAQRFLVALFHRPKFDTPEERAAYAKKPFSEKVRDAKPFADPPFSGTMDHIFDGIGWVVRKVGGVWQGMTRDRTPVVLASGETFASLDKDKSGKLTSDEVPAPSLTTIARWDEDSDGSVTEEEFNTTAGKRSPFRLEFDVDTYDFNEHVFAASAAYMAVLFLICMVCHGELVKSRPEPHYLTSFYLSISAGGALGGLFVGLLCPHIFKTHFELAIALIGGYIAAWMTIFNDGRDRWLKGREIVQWTLAFLLVGTAFFAVRGNLDDIELRRVTEVLPQAVQQRLIAWKIIGKPDEDLIAIERNFYGTIRVERLENSDDPIDNGLALYNGRIWHGFQYTDPSRQLEPSTYYVSGTGAALALERNPRASEGLRVAVIGLGSGSMAAHAREGDTFRFYEIDPKVVKVAQTYFTYLQKSPAHPEVVLGDARISMERELKEHGSMNYDVIHLDAFSGDAIPAHLLTDESFALYTQHLHKSPDGKPDGIVVVHISNRYLDLEPVVAAIAKKHHYKTWNVHKLEEGGPNDTSSDWVLVTNNEQFLNDAEVKAAGEPLAPGKELLWTDQFTALFPIMK